MSALHVFRGDDLALLGNALQECVHQLVGSEDRSLVVEELDGDEYTVASIVAAAQQPPFLTDRRVVVARQAGVFTTTDSVAPLLAYLADPLPTTALVIVWERPPRPGARLGRVPTKLVDAVKKHGVLVDSGAGSGKARDQWLDDQLKTAEIRLDAAARRAVAERIGEDAGLLVGLLGTLTAVFGSDQSVGVDDIRPYLGQEGGVKPFELTDAIDQGDVAGALDKLARLLGGGSWHPLQVMATLSNHYLRMLALDGAGIGDEKAAAELLGLKGSTFPARKALGQTRRLGHERVVRAIDLLAEADLDLRGGKAWPDHLVLEVLVARLATMSR